jgi:predicted dinucleotide-binding enzyme
MRIGVLGTGAVGKALAEAFSARGHDVVVGTRDVDATMARTEPDGAGNPPYAEWIAAHPDIRLVPLADAGRDAEVVVNATSGQGSLEAVGSAGVPDGAVLIDVCNSLDFSAGFPPTLSVANTDSVGEQLQRAFPGVRVVKALNTMTAAVMVRPDLVPGEHNVFVAGEDGAAKEIVTGLLVELGWPAPSVLDLGGIRAARSTEMYLPLWLSMMGVVGSPAFNIRVVRG